MPNQEKKSRQDLINRLTRSKYLSSNRKPSAEEYRKMGINYIDIVHMSLDPSKAINIKQQEIVENVLSLKKEGFKIREISGDLDVHLEESRFQGIVVAGAIEDVCCEIRHSLLTGAGAKAFIDLALTSNY